jgi:hypothetical protein
MIAEAADLMVARTPAHNVIMTLVWSGDSKPNPKSPTPLTRAAA